DEPDAVAMLRQLSGRWHQVFTGVAVTEVPSGHTMHCHETTAVKFRALRASEIDAYVRTKEPLDKAGAYGIQGKGALLVERIDGCYFNVVGLPLVKLARLLARFGVDVWEEGERTGHEVPSDLERTTPR
ncbi:MAG: Maf family protein, partial [bacterium]